MSKNTHFEKKFTNRGALIVALFREVAKNTEYWNKWITADAWYGSMRFTQSLAKMHLLLNK